MKIIAMFAAGLLVCGIGALSAHAASAAQSQETQDKAEMQAALAAKVSLTDAVKTAEAQAGGKAMEVVFSDESGKPGYEVTLVARDGSEKNLFVDATSGKAVTATAANENENNDNGALDDSEEGE